VNGSRTIRVLKRDGSSEPFQTLKLAGAMWRGMQQSRGRYHDARDLAEAIEIHLARTGQNTVTSDTVFAMVIRVLRRVRMGRAGQAIETHRLWRRAQRAGLLVYHGPNKITLWDKGWLCQVAQHTWGISPVTARTVAGAVEADLLAADEIMVTREEVLSRMNEAVSQFGLADAVPVRYAESEL